MLQKIINIGVDPSMDSIRQRVILLHNQFFLVLGFICSLKLIKDLLSYDFYSLVIDTFIVSLVIICLYLTWKNKFDIANGLSVSSFFVFLTTLKIVFGPAIGADIGIMSAMVLSVFFFRKKAQRITIFSAYGLSLIASSWWVASHGVIVSEGAFISEFYYSFLIGGAIIILFVTINVLTEREAYQRQTEKLLAELKDSDTLLKAQKKELESANTDLERFVFMASHDLKSPLRNISSFINLINRKTKEYNDPVLDEYIDFVLKGTNNMQSLISGILDYSKIINPENTSVDLNKVVQEVQSNLQQIVAERKVMIRINKLPNVLSDHTQMVMLFQNLVQNGIKYNQSSQPTIDINCNYTVNTFKICITDNGIGISPEFHTKVFEMFSRLHNESEYSGTGIGLATCKRIIEKSGGGINIESPEKGGCTFILEWPIDKIVISTTPESVLESA